MRKLLLPLALIAATTAFAQAPSSGGPGGKVIRTDRPVARTQQASAHQGSAAQPGVKPPPTMIVRRTAIPGLKAQWMD